MLVLQVGPEDTWSAQGLEACNLDTSTPGARMRITYTIPRFSVSVTRTVVVQADCLAGEVPCGQLGQCAREWVHRMALAVRERV